MDANKNRINVILTNILEEKKNEIDEIDKKGVIVDNRLKNLQKVVFDHLKKQCFKEIKWIESHGKITRSDDGFKIHINNNPGVEADAHIREFYDCAKASDIGISSYINEVNSYQNRISSQNDHCITKCLETSKDETDTNLKYCINSCIEKALRETDAVYDKINNKIDTSLNRYV